MSHGLTARLTIRLAVGGAAWLVFAAPATAGRVGWNEAAKFKGAKVMTYTVETLTFDAKGWRARVSFRNTSRVSIGVRSGFGVVLYGNPRSTTLAKGQMVPALTFSKKLPKSLRPGASWTGIIGSPGQLATPHRIYARVVFGPFAGMPGTTTAVVWVTNHVKPLGHGRPQVLVPVPATGPPII